MADTLQILRRMYDNASRHYTLPDFDTFCKDMQDDKKRRAAYEKLSGAYDLPDFATFTRDVTITPAAPEPQQPQQPQQQPSFTPIADSTVQQARVHSTVPADSVQKTVQPPQLDGWKPSSMQQRAFQQQMDNANASMQLQNEQFEQRMEGIKKGNRPGAFMGERQFNPQTGQWETNYYTTQGESVSTPVEQSRNNTEYHHWWEENTEAGQRSKKQRLQREFDAKLSYLWQRHNPEEGENAAEQAWSAAEERQRVAGNRNADKNWDSYVAMGGGRELRTVTSSMNRHDDMVAHFTNFDLDRLMNDAWENLGEEGQKSLIDDCHQMLRYRNPGADDLVLYQQAKELARQQSDLRLYNLAVEKNLPQNNLEYLLRKIGDANLLNSISKGLAVSSAGTTGDVSALEQANEQYRQDGHKVVDVVGTVSGMALDPTMWISGGVGAGAGKLALNIGGRRIVGAGASAAVRKAAATEFASTLGGRITAGMVGGAANFGTYEGLKEIESQFEHGGHIVGRDESGRFINEGYSAGAVAGQAVHGLLMGASIGWITPLSGNLGDKLVRGGGKIFGHEVGGIASTAGKVGTRAGLYTGATVLEGTIFSIPGWMDGKRDGFDVWTDNIAMMVGFKTPHMIKTAGGVLGDLQKSFESPANGRKNRLDFENRLRQRMDAPSDGGLALTKDERAELERLGYGDLRELVESAERTGNAAEGGMIAENAPQMVSRLTDMVQDTRLSEAARAKMYYYATGRKLPESTIMRGEMYEDGNGGFVVESQGANGVITSRTFTSRKAADLELERINRQTELNHIELGERYQQTADFENRLQEACREVAAENGWDMVEVYRTCEEARRNHLRGGDKQFDEAQQNILRKVTDAMGEFEETGVTDAIRGSINEKYGVDIDAAIRKEPNRRTQAEQTAIDEYLGELIPDKAKEHTVEDAEAEDIPNQKRPPSENEPPANEFGEVDPIDPRFNGGEPSPDYDLHQPDGEQKPIGRAVMKYQDRQVEVLSGRVVLTSDGTMIDNASSDKTIVIRDIATGKVEMVSPEAILKYEDLPIEQAAETGAPADEPSTFPSEYKAGSIVFRDENGQEQQGYLTGDVVTAENYDEMGTTPDNIGKYEYYIAGNLEGLRYATKEELDNMLIDYKPDAPKEPEQPAEGNIEGENIPADPKQYEEGYTVGMGQVENLSDEQLEAQIVKLTTEADRLTDFGKGMLAAYQHEQQRRAAEAAPAEQPVASSEAGLPTPPIEDVNIDISDANQLRTPGGALMPGTSILGTIEHHEGNGTTRTLVVGKTADGENIVVDNERGFMWGHDGNGGNMKPYRPGESAPTWTDEQIAILGTVQPIGEQPAAVPITPETVPNPTENPVSDAEIVPEAVSTVENVQQTPLQRLPRDEKGNPIFEQAETPEAAWDALVEFSEGDAGAAKEIADVMVEEKRKAFEKAQKLKSKGKTPTEILASRKANVAELTNAQAEFEYWQKMAAVEQNRQAAIHSQQEAEARRIAAERAEAEKAEREAREEQARIEREALEGIPEWHLDTPENARKRGMRRYQGQLYTRQTPIERQGGKDVTIKFSDNEKVDGYWAVVDASQLQPSHKDGQRNPMFFVDEMQPKNRTDVASQLAARKIAEELDPEEIIFGKTAYTGAPVVMETLEVVQGTNRTNGLQHLWENNLTEQQERYRSALLAHEEELELGSYHDVIVNGKPALVRVVPVSDQEGIRLGQMTAQDTESGGIERIKPKNVAQKLGDDMRQFANMLLRSGDEEATFGQLVDRNGTDVMKWMNQVGAISNTQYQSAFDSKGNLTAEAKNDLQKVLYQAVFKGGSQQLEEMFDRLPAKAQRAILATAFRDMDSPFAGKMLPEIQASIVAYNELMTDPAFAGAKKLEGALRAVQAFKATTALDDRLEQYSPSDNFSNFALHLAAMYKAGDYSQGRIAALFNEMYDLAQGRKEATLFEDSDTTEYPLADVIKKVLNIDYKPAKNGNNNVANGGADVALRNQGGQGGELRGKEPPASGEQTPAGTEPSDRGAGVEDGSAAAGGRRNVQPTDERKDNLHSSETGKLDNDRLTQRRERIRAVLGLKYSLSDEQANNGELFYMNSEGGTELARISDEIFDRIGVDPVPFKLTETMGWHVYNNHAKELGLANMDDAIDSILDIINNVDHVRLGRDNSYIFSVENGRGRIGKRAVTIVVNSETGEFMGIRTSGYDRIKNLKERPLLWQRGADSATEAVATPTVTTIKAQQGDEHVGRTEGQSKGERSKPVSANSSDIETDPEGKRNGTATPQSEPYSEGKDNNSLTDEQISGEESSSQLADDKDAGLEQPSAQAAVEAASAEVDTNPTEAQKEAGNYKKGHVTIGDFDITIENPAGSVRKGVDANGKPWETKMANAYGYILNTESTDGDHIDVFLAEDMDRWDARRVFVIDQTKEDGSFDEHKVMLGFNDGHDAMRAYLANYDAAWAEKHPGLRISEVNIEDFNKWIQSSHRKTKPFADYSTVSKITDNAPTEPPKNDGFTIEARKDTRDNSDIYAVKFEEGVSRDEFKGQKAIAKKHGGYWSNFGKKGFLFKSEADAKAFADEVMDKSEDEIADQAPLSMTDMGKSAEKKSKADSPFKKVNVEGLMGDLNTAPKVSRMTSGAVDVSLSDHAEPVEERVFFSKGRTLTQSMREIGQENDLGFEVTVGERYRYDGREIEIQAIIGTNVRWFDKGLNRTFEEPAGVLDGVEPMKPAKKRSRWVSDEDAAEFDELRSSLRSHLGTDTPDLVQEDAPAYGHKKSPSKNRRDLTTRSGELLAPTSTGSAKLDKLRDNPKAELVRQDLTTISSQPSDNAKLVKISENLQKLSQKYKGVTDVAGAYTDFAEALQASKHGNGASTYSRLKLPTGQTVEVRISNHNANADTFAKNGSLQGNISIVFKSRRSRNTFRTHPEVELMEYVYTTEAIKSDGNMLSQVAESLRRMIETGEYVDLTGKAIVNRSPVAEGDLVMEDAQSYGKLQPKQMDAEVLRMGTRMTYLMMKGGLRKFSDYAEAMVEEVGDAIRPHLKSLYAAAQNMEEVIDLGWDEEMDDRKTVKSFDVYNFDKPGAKDIIETAQHIVDEQQSQKDTDDLIEGLTAERNEKRRQREGNSQYAPVGQEDYVSFAQRVAADGYRSIDGIQFDVESGTKEVTDNQRVLGKAVAGLLKDVGIEVVTDSKAMQSEYEKSLPIAVVRQYSKELSPRDIGLDPASYAAKLRSISDNLAEIAEKYEGSKDWHGIISDLAICIGAKGGASKYADIRIDADHSVSVRISNHNADASNYALRGRYDSNISIVFKSRKSGNRFHHDGRVELTEYVYAHEDISKDGRIVAGVARSLAEMLKTGEYRDLTGKAMVNRSPSLLQAIFKENDAKIVNRTQFLRTSRGDETRRYESE